MSKTLDEMVVVASGKSATIKLWSAILRGFAFSSPSSIATTTIYPRRWTTRRFGLNEDAKARGPRVPEEQSLKPTGLPVASRRALAISILSRSRFTAKRREQWTPASGHWMSSKQTPRYYLSRCREPTAQLKASVELPRICEA